MQNLLQYEICSILMIYYKLIIKIFKQTLALHLNVFLFACICMHNSLYSAQAMPTEAHYITKKTQYITGEETSESDSTHSSTTVQTSLPMYAEADDEGVVHGPVYTPAPMSIAEMFFERLQRITADERARREAAQAREIEAEWDNPVYSLARFREGIEGELAEITNPGSDTPTSYSSVITSDLLSGEADSINNAARLMEEVLTEIIDPEVYARRTDRIQSLVRDEIDTLQISARLYRYSFTDVSPFIGLRLAISLAHIAQAIDHTDQLLGRMMTWQNYEPYAVDDEYKSIYEDEPAYEYEPTHKKTTIFTKLKAALSLGLLSGALGFLNFGPYGALLGLVGALFGLIMRANNNLSSLLYRNGKEAADIFKSADNLMKAIDGKKD